MTSQNSPLAQRLEDRVTAWDFGPATVAGPTVYLQAQLHGNETTGALVLHALVDRYSKEPPPVPLRIVPHANPFAWDAVLEAGHGRISAPGERNWNRIFDFSHPEATIGLTAEAALRERLWHLSEPFDVVLDLHTPEFGRPHVYVSSVETGLNTFTDLPHVLYGEPTAPTFDETHRRYAQNKRVATLELPSDILITHRTVDYWAERVHAEIWSHAQGVGVPPPPANCGTMIDLVPGISGIAMPMAEPGRKCAAGKKLLRVIAHDGSYEDMFAPTECIPVCYRRSTLVKAGYWAIRVVGMERKVKIG